MVNAIQANAPTTAIPPDMLLAQGTSRPSLTDVRRDYQVQIDTMVDWQPRALGIVPLADARSLTTTEARMLDGLQSNRGLLGLQEFAGIRDDALATAVRTFPATGPVPAAVERQIQTAPAGDRASLRDTWRTSDGHNDAFRHAYWSARLTQAYGAEWAQQFTTAHEAVPGSINNSAVREAMDLYNNSVGIRIAEANPNASPARLAELVETAVRNGETVVVGQSGQLAWSDQVAIGQHGRAAPGGNGDGGQAIPDGRAYIRSY
jgi:hypothetical protein